MAASDHLSGKQLTHLEYVGLRYIKPAWPGGSHTIIATSKTKTSPDIGAKTFVDDKAAHMSWRQSGPINEIYVNPDIQRKGVGTRMWNLATALSRANPNIPEPQHATERTPAGDAWAKKVGGALPKREKGVRWNEERFEPGNF